MDYRLELINVPVSDVDRAIEFYAGRVGFHLDVDARVDENIRFVQLTPPGSACSISLTEGVPNAEPGCYRGLQLVVADADAAGADLRGRGVEVGPVEEFPWGRFVYFADPDGNQWSVQQVPVRE